MKPTFVFSRRVAYYETDAMGVVHHSNHVRYFEEARVAWLRARELMEHHAPHGPFVFAVTEQSARYQKTALFDDALEIHVQSRLDRLRIHFQYAIYSPRLQAFIADGRTTLVPILAVNFKPARLPAIFEEVYASEQWDEVWPPSASLSR